MFTYHVMLREYCYSQHTAERKYVEVNKRHLPARRAHAPLDAARSQYTQIRHTCYQSTLLPDLTNTALASRSLLHLISSHA